MVSAFPTREVPGPPSKRTAAGSSPAAGTTCERAPTFRDATTKSPVLWPTACILVRRLALRFTGGWPRLLSGRLSRKEGGHGILGETALAHGTERPDAATPLGERPGAVPELSSRVESL